MLLLNAGIALGFDPTSGSLDQAIHDALVKGAWALATVFVTIAVIGFLITRTGVKGSSSRRRY